jgi:hypothetical protein
MGLHQKALKPRLLVSARGALPGCITGKKKGANACWNIKQERLFIRIALSHHADM